MRTDELDFELPKDRIATRPAEPRDSARLMVVSRSDPDRVEHAHIRDLPRFLERGDVLAVNTTRVLPARFLGVNRATGGRVQGLWLGERRGAGGSLEWRTMIKSRRHRPGWVIELRHPDGSATGVAIELLDRAEDEEAGAWWVRVLHDGGATSEALLERAGMTPLPPYIIQARRSGEIEVADELDRAAYQTLYAGEGDAAGAPVAGSVAAPTAGLHFTPRLLDEIRAMGVDRADLTLQVGAGTFKPIETDVVEDHPMHAEWCRVPGPARGLIFGEPRRRVVAVGSTSARTIEAHAIDLEAGRVPGDWLETDILIAPGYRWRRVDVMLTNFHLPRSTLIAMVGALFPEGVERVKRHYAEAVERGYRFFSYGDAMLILP